MDLKKTLVAGLFVGLGVMAWSCSSSSSTAPSAAPTATFTPTPSLTATLTPTSTATPTCTTTTTPSLIEDMADGDSQIIVQQCRNGFWYTTADGYGTSVTPASGGGFTMSSPGHSGSGNAARMHGTLAAAATPVIYPYCLMGFGLTSPVGSYPAPAGSTGIQFYAKAVTTSGYVSTIRFLVGDRNTSSGGVVCTTCNDHHGVNVPLTGSWAPYTAAFSTLTQSGFGAPQVANVDTQHLFTLNWEVSGYSQNFDVWVDDISFY